MKICNLLKVNKLTFCLFIQTNSNRMKTLFAFVLCIVSLAVNAQENIIKKAQDKLIIQQIEPNNATTQQWAGVLQEIGKTEQPNPNLIVCTDELENRAMLYFVNSKLESSEYYFSDKYPVVVTRKPTLFPKYARSDKKQLAKVNMPILDTKNDNSKTTILKPDSTLRSNMPIKTH